MGKIFIWAFGFTVGAIAGVVWLGVSMLMDPDRFIEVLKYDKNHR